MKALSIKQPWASLIIKGAPTGLVFKDIENRDWYSDFRGRIYVHAPQREDDFIETMRWLGEHIGLAPFACMMLSSKSYSPRGAIIGEVDIVDCVTQSKSPWFVGKYGFVLVNPKAYSAPIPYRGRLGFFEVNI